MKKILLVVSILFALSLNTALAQDPLFSLYRNAPLYLNPALTGAQSDIAFHSSYRSQWRSIDVPYVTSHFSLIKPVYYGKGRHFKQLGGVGLSLLNDKAGKNGVYKSTGLYSNFAYNVSLSKNDEHSLHFGMQVGLRQRRIDLDNFRWGEQYNRYIGYDQGIESSEDLMAGKINFDIGSGIYYTYSPDPRKVMVINKLFAGVAASHLNYPNQSLILESTFRTPPLFKFHGGVDWKVSEQFFIETQNLTMIQMGTNQINVGSNFSYYLLNKDKNYLQNSYVSFGTWYRVKDSFIFSAEVGSNFYKLGLSYDLNTSAIGQHYRGAGAFEISLAAIMYKERRKTRGIFR